MFIRKILFATVLTVGTFNLTALTTSFSGQSGSTVSDSVGGIDVDFASTGSGEFNWYGVLMNNGTASYTLTFSQAVMNLSFDIVNMSNSWSDTFTNFEVDGAVASISIATALSGSFSSGGLAAWDGSALSATNSNQAARMNFSESSITSVTFDSSGSRNGNHYVGFDNFSFEAAATSSVPDSSQTLLLLGPALLALAVVARRR